MSINKVKTLFDRMVEKSKPNIFEANSFLTSPDQTDLV